MDKNFCYSFPAIKGNQACKDYFVIMCPLGVLSKLFIFNEDELPAEYRAQRTINKTRIPEIAHYILNNPHDYVFSSLTASVDGNFEFLPINFESYRDIGTLKISMDSKLLINDGQHRRAAIEEALKADSKLADETISVVLFIDENLKKSQQIFADLNKHAVNVSKSLGVLYDSRDPVARITKSLLDKNTYLKHYTDKENPSLSKFSPKLFTLSSIYESNKKLVRKLNLNDPKVCSFVEEFWNVLCCNMIEWQFVFNKQITPHLFRSDYISSNGVILEALGLVGNFLFKHNPNDWEAVLCNIKNIDWHRSNLDDWQYRVIGTNGRITKSATNIILSNNLIKIKLNLSLSKEEEKLEKDYKKGD